MQPIRKIQIFIVHRNQNISDQTRHGHRKIFDINGVNINDFFNLQLSGIIFVPMKDIRAECGADKTMGAVRVVMETGLQRDHAFRTKVYCFLDLTVFKVPEMDVLAIFSLCNIFQIEPGHKGIRRSPFCRYHHIMTGLIPKIITEVHASGVVFPAPNNVEVLIQMQISSRCIALGIPQH